MPPARSSVLAGQADKERPAAGVGAAKKNPQASGSGRRVAQTACSPKPGLRAPGDRLACCRQLLLTFPLMAQMESLMVGPKPRLAAGLGCVGCADRWAFCQRGSRPHWASGGRPAQSLHPKALLEGTWGHVCTGSRLSRSSHFVEVGRFLTSKRFEG